MNLNLHSTKKKENDNNNQNYIPSEITEWDDADMLHKNLLRGIYSYGFEKPSPIQRKALLTVIDGKDTIAQAQSGTGKTGCFTVSVLQKIDLTKDVTQALILSPTHELSYQTNEVLKGIGSLMKGLKTHVLVGGTSVEKDIDILKNDTPHIICGCPGRTHDLLRRKHLKKENIKIIILDEADEMLNFGFKDQIYNIFQFLPYNIQICLFSATMPKDLHSLTDKFLREPVKILVQKEQLTLEGIAQYFIALDDDNSKYDTLKDIYNTISMSQCIIYCNSVRRVQDLYDAMKGDGYPVCCIYGSMDKTERNESYNSFKTGSCRVLISSDVTARGIDIQQVSTVINYDIPKDVHVYLHRIGRSGRWGRKGSALNFVTKFDYHLLKQIEEYYNTQINELPQSFNEV